MAEVTEKDRQMAQVCEACPICSNARRAQKGIAFWFVSRVEERYCPYCQAYEKVNGRKAHEPADVA